MGGYRPNGDPPRPLSAFVTAVDRPTQSWISSEFFSLLLVASGVILLARQGGVQGEAAAQRRRRYRSRNRCSCSTHARSFPIVLIVLLVRAFVFEPFRIPSASMMPGLVDGDYIFVDKFSYGLRLPVFNTKILSYRRTAARRCHRVLDCRRILPSTSSSGWWGCREITSWCTTIESRSMERRSRSNATATMREGSVLRALKLALEWFGPEKTMSVMFAPNRDATDFEAVVPAGHYFFMGDNRNDSEDSRFPVVGFVPEQNLVGHAIRIWMNWRIPGWPEWRRIGTKIHLRLGSVAGSRQTARQRYAVVLRHGRTMSLPISWHDQIASPGVSRGYAFPRKRAHRKQRKSKAWEKVRLRRRLNGVESEKFGQSCRCQVWDRPSREKPMKPRTDRTVPSFSK